MIRAGQPAAPADPRVGVLIKATALDAPFLDVMVRHMIAQAKYPFAERVLVVDRPRSFTGKYSTRPRASERDLERTIAGLLRDGVVDDARDVDAAPHRVEEITHRYFESPERPVPTHAATGGPIYATLFGLESMSTDYVLQMDADVLFHSDGQSWVRRALQCMARDPNLWLMMTHPGPPTGPPGRSLGARQRGQASWDEPHALWRFRHATTRYFLCDRRVLRGRVPLVETSRGVAPLEQCISRALQRHRAFRGALGDLASWHLHVWSHDPPFPAWARTLATAVEAGRFPETQRGRYDLRLDLAADRERWARVLERPEPNRSGAARTAKARGRGPTAPVWSEAPLTVVIPVRDRAGQRLQNTLRSLRWQSTGPPMEVLVVSHGSRPEINADLGRICREESATLIAIGRPGDAWNKSLALNTGIRRSRADAPYLMTMDADMVLSQHFLSVVLELLSKRPALVLCRISDLPPDASLPEGRDDLLDAFDGLRRQTTLRARSGSGGVQAASRSFFFAIRGYDEDLIWWGGMDGDLVNRARLVGLRIRWIEDRAVMLHQWHPRKHAILTRPDQIRKARKAWRRNHWLVQFRRRIIRRNPAGWGGNQEGSRLA